jgi:hypothetical protein
MMTKCLLLFIASLGALYGQSTNSGGVITQEELKSIPVSDRCGWEVSKDLIRSIDRLDSRPFNDLEKCTAIANAYFEHVFGSCGAFELGPADVSYWVFTTKVGYGAQPGPSIKISKTTGSISCEGKEFFPSYRALRSHLLTTPCTRTVPQAAPPVMSNR